MQKEPILLAAIVASLFVVPVTAEASIITTKHNLSVSGQSTIKSASETRVCVFCHTPHNANPGVPLWGHSLPNPVGGYSQYQSTTMDAATGQPDGASKLCLSCHDGTIAVGSVLSGEISMAGVDANGKLVPGTPANLGTDLTNDHPVSFVPVTGLEIQNPPGGSQVQLDQNGKLQCSSCHDPHGTTLDKFLVKTTSYGALCVECHNKTGWIGSAHEQADKVVSISYWREGPGYAYLATKDINVKERSCLICHSVHSPVPLKRLRLNEEPAPAYYDQWFGTEEWVCLVCHDGLSAVNIKAMFHEGSVSIHDVSGTTDVHDTGESFTDLQDNSIRHVECSDCHEPHQVKSGLHLHAESSGAGPTLNGARGVEPNFPATPWTSLLESDFTPVILSNDGVVPSPNSQEAYLCFKCHPAIARDFNPKNATIHNVLGLDIVTNTAKYREPVVQYDLGYVGSSAPLPQPDLGPSPYGPYGPDTKLTCTECHTTSWQSVGQGPHAAWQEKLLQMPGPSALADGTVEYDDIICFKCHLSNVYAYFVSDYDKDRDGRYSNFRSTGEGLHVLSHGTKGWNCFLCHSTTVAHGFKRRRGIVYVTDGLPYYNPVLAGRSIDINGVDHGNNGIYGYRDPRSEGRDYYIKDDCWTGCHYYSMGILTGEPIHPYKEGVQYEP